MMKYASLSATSQKKYHWYADSDEFREVAENEWLRWHEENMGGWWFGMVARKKSRLFLAGKLPTKRVDSIGRKIITYIILQPESAEEAHSIGLLSANLLREIELESFFQWADKLALAQENGNEIPPFYKMFNPKQTSVTRIGRFKYNCTNMMQRAMISESTEALLRRQKDFLIAVIWYSPERFFAKTGEDLAWNAPVAIFSPLASGTRIPRGKNIFSAILDYSAPISIIAGFLIIVSCFVILYMSIRNLNNLNNELQQEINQLKTDLKNSG